MKKPILPIPAFTEGIIDMNIQDLTDFGLKKDLAVFILGSLVYQTPNEREERTFKPSIEAIPKFEIYKNFFLRKGLLLHGKEENTYFYSHDLDCDRYLEPYDFDSAIAGKLIREEFPNFSKYLENVFIFLKPNLEWNSLPF